MKRKILDIRYWILDTGCWILVAGYWILDTRHFKKSKKAEDS